MLKDQALLVDIEVALFRPEEDGNVLEIKQTPGFRAKSHWIGSCIWGIGYDPAYSVCSQ